VLIDFGAARQTLATDQADPEADVNGRFRVAGSTTASAQNLGP
jgi:hypothetical protein